MASPVPLTELLDVYDLGEGELSAEPMDAGVTAEIWRLETTSGTWAVKVWRELFATYIAGNSVGVCLQDAAVAGGVTAPSVWRSREGGGFALVGGRPVQVQSWIDLLPLDLGLDPVRLGEMLARLHHAGASLGDIDPLGRVDPWYSEPFGAPVWDALMQRALDEGAPFASGLAAIRDELVALEALIDDPPEDLLICHRDLFAENVRPTPSGAVAAFDFDNSGLADPGQELASLVVEFATDLEHGTVDRDRARAIQDAYAAAGGKGRIDGLSSFTMPIAQRGHITEISARLWLDADTPHDRDRLVGWVEEMVRFPLTRQVIEEILDA